MGIFAILCLQALGILSNITCYNLSENMHLIKIISVYKSVLRSFMDCKCKFIYLFDEILLHEFLHLDT